MDPFREDVPVDGLLPRAANPFRPGAGKVPPAFGGRTAPLLAAKTVVDRLAVPADPVDLPVFRGFRGTGKTALMAYARSHAAAGGTVTLHIEADPSDATLAATCATLARDAAALTTDVASSIAKRLAALDLKGRVEFHPTPEADPGSNIEALLHDLVLLGEARQVGILLTVDEAHEAERLLLRPLIRAMHRHAQDARAFGVMISGLPGVADTLMAEGQTYTERLISFDLGLLDREGTADALTVPFAEDVGIEVTDDAIDAVHADAAGYPWFVQLWGASLWNTLTHRGPVTADDVERARPHVTTATDQFYRRRWSRVPDGRARDVVRALASRGGAAAIGELLADVGLEQHGQLSPARAELIARGLVFAPSHGRLAFTVPGFDRWVVDHT
ncbi:MAG: ATP-binding protein [Actinobacteria bacterium]|nr:ATP-binding protein [Actinomycetota bacterium]